MKNDLTKRLTRTAIIAAIYAVITVAIAPLSYMGVQFRISEILVLLAVFDPLYIGGLTLGCLIANLLGPNGPMDVLFGTLATFISVYLVYLTGKYMKGKKGYLIIASLWPTIVNAIIVGGVMLHGLFKLPLILSILQVGFGQFVVITIIGVPLFRFLNNKYSKLLKDILN